MLNRRWMMAALLASTLPASIASAYSLEEKKDMKYQEEQLKSEELDLMKEKCGVDIKFSFKWDTYNFEHWNKGNWSKYGYCSSAPATVRRLCDDADAKPEVVAKIKSIVCQACPKDGKKKEISLKNGVLTWTSCPGAPDDGNNDDFIQAYLMKSL